MNVYDFDGTVYRGDSSVDFFLFCLMRNPALICCVPTMAKGAAAYLAKRIDKTAWKEYNFAFLQSLPSVGQSVAAFWQTHERKLYEWYLRQKQPSDVIVSASPSFLLQPICDKLGVALIASEVDPRSGRFLGKNCHDAEKVIRFRALYPTAVIDAFYSDSVSDQPMADLSVTPYRVRLHRPQPWSF